MAADYLPDGLRSLLSGFRWFLDGYKKCSQKFLLTIWCKKIVESFVKKFLSKKFCRKISSQMFLSKNFCRKISVDNCVEKFLLKVGLSKQILAHFFGLVFWWLALDILLHQSLCRTPWSSERFCSVKIDFSATFLVCLKIPALKIYEFRKKRR